MLCEMYHLFNTGRYLQNDCLKVFVKVTQTNCCGPECVFVFFVWQVRCVVILSEDRWELKCLFEPHGLIKKKEWKWLSSLSITTAIFLGSFRLPYEEIRDIVLEVDEERLSESLIQVRLMFKSVVCFPHLHRDTAHFSPFCVEWEVLYTSPWPNFKLYSFTCPLCSQVALLLVSPSPFHVDHRDRFLFILL